VQALVIVGGLAVFAAILVVAFHGTVNKAINELTLPLEHEDIIRQQAKEKGVDAALIAAVIDTESKFLDSAQSGAGARGLMQITPEAAKDIARHSGATSFKTSDLSNPEINIKYGTYLLAERIEQYGGNVAAALASYNAGPGPVEKWGGNDLKVENITYPETRAYVELVLERQKEYRKKYAKELGYGSG
jgi:soluble lytic murein transglycosylase